MTCYASPHGLRFGTHWDCSASFILQIEGSKRWRFSAKPAVQWPPTLLPNASVVQEMMDRYPWLQVRFPEERRRNIPGAGIDARGCIVFTRGDMA